MARLAQQQPLSLCIKVPRGGGSDLSREFASKMFERTNTRLPVCQNRDVLMYFGPNSAGITGPPQLWQRKCLHFGNEHCWVNAIMTM